MFKIILPRILRVASLIFAPCVLFMNLLIALATGSTSNMLKLLFVFIILIISVLISTFVVIFNEKKSFSKRPIIYLWFMAFSILFIISNSGAVISSSIAKEAINLWNIVTMCILLAVSLIYSVSHLYIKIPSPFSYIYRYLIYAGMLYTCVVSISGYGTGTSNVIIFGIYTFIFFLTVISISISKHKKKEKELEKEEYENQFS